jgi:hypothetical protein
MAAQQAWRGIARILFPSVKTHPTPVTSATWQLTFFGPIFDFQSTFHALRLMWLKSNVASTWRSGRAKPAPNTSKGDTIMKRITALALFTLASILGVGSAFAQVQSREVRATVPFDFTVGDKQLPAGTYFIAQATDGTVQIQNRKTRVVMFTLASQNGSPSTGCLLDFDKYAGQNFLHAVLCQSAAISINLPASRLENRARVQEAKLHHSGGQIMIAAN